MSWRDRPPQRPMDTLRDVVEVLSQLVQRLERIAVQLSETEDLLDRQRRPHGSGHRDRWRR